MRMFIAVNFDNDTRQKLFNIQSRLKMLGTGSFSPTENLHLTLAFLGEVNPDRVSTIRKIMDEVNFHTLHLTFDRVGSFKRKDGDIWWAGLAQNYALSELQKDLIDELRKAGFPLEDRTFVPHITLARRVKLNKNVDKSALMEAPFSTTASTVSLMLSERINGKLTYTEQYSVHAIKD
jgi:2'-5' RNA ligase